jgi:FkbM family methyltransferase
MKIAASKLNWIELSMMGALVAILGAWGGAHYSEVRLRPFMFRAALGERAALELAPMAKKYGPQRNTEHAEEWIVRDFFQDRRGGVFVDVGANDYRHHSNTYYLETALGWSGLAIEPQAKFASDYATHRPSTRFLPLFVSDSSNHRATLYVPANDQIASFDRHFAESVSNSAAEPISTNTATLDEILDGNNIRHVDFLSIDIELHEPQALRGFSIERFRPNLVAIESHTSVRQQILDYFALHGYVSVGKYLRIDGENLWFTPLSETDNSVVAQR